MKAFTIISWTIVAKVFLRSISTGLLLALISGVSLAYELELYTPETGSHADTGYYLHWSDGDPVSHSVSLYAVPVTPGNEIQINSSPIDASASGYDGNKFFWDTCSLAPGDYFVRMELQDENQQTVASKVSDNSINIRHHQTENQEIYIYPFIHLKNSFLMGSESNALYRLLDLLEEVGFNQFEFTFNWPIAYYLEHGLVDDQTGFGYIFDPQPELIQALIAYADAGGAIGSYEPLAGWHYNNIWRAYTGDYANWMTLGRLAIKYETTYQDQLTGDFPALFQPGAKHYLDQLFQRKTIELGSNQPVVNFHITRLLGNKVVCQWHPQEIANDSCYRIINGKDYYDGGCMFWYLGQLTFSHYISEEESPIDETRTFERQIPLFSDDYYSTAGIPLDQPSFQSFQENVDTALEKIHTNNFPHDIFYIFEHSISLENIGDQSSLDSKQAYVDQFGGLYSDWTYSRLSHMNCREAIKLPENNFEYCFMDNESVSYKTTEPYLSLRCSVFKDSFRFIQHLASHDSNIHIVSCDDMYDMVRPQADQIVSKEKLDRIAISILDNIYQDATGARMPAYIRLESGDSASVEYYHLAETYKMFADALRVQYRIGRLPDEVIAKNVVGPTALHSDNPELSQGVVFTPNQIVQAAFQLNMSDPLAVQKTSGRRK